MDVYDSPLWIALSDRDFERAARLVAEGTQLDQLIEEDGNTLLHDAAQDGDLETVDFFLRHGCPRSLQSFDYIDQTPLIRAADNGRTEVVERLLAAGADPDANAYDKAGNTAIREAVRGGHVEIVARLLRAGADPTIPGWMGISAVDQAWYEIRGPREAERSIRQMLAGYPSTVRDG